MEGFNFPWITDFLSLHLTFHMLLMSQIKKKKSRKVTCGSQWREEVLSVQFSRSVMSDSFDPMNCSTPGLPVYHQLKLMSTESVMPSNHLILCLPLLLPSIFPSISVFSSKSVFHKWKWKWSRSVVSDSSRPMDCSPPRSSGPWDSPGENTGVGCQFLPQGTFPTQGSSSRPLHWQVPSLPLCHLEL